MENQDRHHLLGSAVHIFTSMFLLLYSAGVTLSNSWLKSMLIYLILGLNSVCPLKEIVLASALSRPLHLKQLFCDRLQTQVSDTRWVGLLLFQLPYWEYTDII